MTKFKQLSFWARDHKWSSRFIIVFSFIAINILGVIIGLLFSDLNIILSKWFIAIAVLAFGVAWLNYPGKKHKSQAYVFRKTCDAILISTTFLMFIYFGNHKTSPLTNSIFSAAASSSLPKDSTKTYQSVEEFKKSLYDESGNPLKWKERKKLLKQQVKAIKKDKTMSDGGKVGLIILCVLLALVLAYGVAALSCSLSCSGSEGAATVVAILGFAGIILLTFFVIRSITRKTRKEKAKEIKPESPVSNN